MFEKIHRNYSMYLVTLQHELSVTSLPITVQYICTSIRYSLVLLLVPGVHISIRYSLVLLLVPGVFFLQVGDLVFQAHHFSIIQTYR